MGGVIPRSRRTCIERLRELLVNTDRFAEISEFFHAELVPDAEFYDAGRVDHNAEVQALMETALRSVLPTGSFSGLMLIHVADHGMWHGFGRWGAGLSTLLFFEDLGVGLVSYANSLVDARTHHIRLTRADSRGVRLPALRSPVPRAQA